MLYICKKKSERKIHIAIFVDLIFLKTCFNLLPSLLKNNLEDVRNKKEKERLGWDVQCFVKRKAGGGGPECEKHYDLGKVSAYCEILYPRNTVESLKKFCKLNILLFFSWMWLGFLRWTNWVGLSFSYTKFYWVFWSSRAVVGCRTVAMCLCNRSFFCDKPFMWPLLSSLPVEVLLSLYRFLYKGYSLLMLL